MTGYLVARDRDRSTRSTWLTLPADGSIGWTHDRSAAHAFPTREAAALAARLYGARTVPTRLEIAA